MGGAEESGSTGTGRPTSRDVARLAGVSHTAVSFVFNGRAEGNLSPATQERIRQAAAQLGYRPDPVARGLRRRRTAVIGLVTDEIASSPFAGRLLRGAMETAWDSDHLVLTVDSGGDPVKEDAAVAELLDRRVDGIVYAAMSLRRVRVPEGLHRTHSVLANCLPEDDSLPAVVPAERAGGRSAARLLLGAGHRRLAVIGGLDDIASVERTRGFRDALRAEGVTVPGGWIVRGGGEISAGYAGALRLLDGVEPGRRPTGVLCYNDRVAAGVLHAATRLGIDVPADLSVVGYDDQEHMAAFLTPPLTSVALPHRAMGEAAARLLLDAIEAGRTPPATVRRLACPVVSRASVGPAPTR
ncbi:LacI family DNA-binding transcriptional regulator [Streptomyces sp. NBC_00201]|uniref:LacI family DNA-binding transcriptional regulator n=1 Tax=unclassified Streptomyces TaxID=2593676 RepID=UPI00225566CC|nr:MULTISPECIES: LacI family DNA-binding transcriptional regulator [unclassified Streptomyces]MCX5054864.1 LacI family DNA-binding transcriptional regulator [Streptomyces sp. NBC_00474]MCX5058739.1 LacI family DNA-binding transcriptional regulator [Streptomyces sp. NBC_00452]MCX5244380.1 LacI family DNA-binding transcriptional regulator [Streptomyces sp. NBC_00201]MCX5289888.1 LacI family DNA-binding transcriptional regulator [Streptomyces sp. NBC_00183]